MSDSDILIEDFIKKTMEKIESGLGSKYAIDGAVNFELSLGISKETQGGFKINVLGIGRKVSDEATQIVDFSVVAKDSPDYEAQKLFMSKIRDFLSQPNDKIIEFFTKGNNNQEVKQIEAK